MSENYGDEWRLTWYLLREIYIKSNLNPLTNSLAAAEAQSFKDILQAL